VFFALFPQSHAEAFTVPSYLLYEDKSGAMSAAQVAKQDFILVERSAIAKGWNKSVFWLKLDLSSKDKTLRYLTIAPAYLTNSNLYRLSDGEWANIQPDNPVNTLNTLARQENDVFPIPAYSESDQFLLRIEAPKIVLAQFWLESREELIARVVSLSESLMFYLGLVCFISFYFLWNGIVKRNLFFLATVALGLEIGLFRLLIAGVKLPLGIGSSVAFMDIVMTVGIPFTCSFYFLALLKEHKIKGQLHTISLISFVVWCGFAVLYLFDKNNYFLIFSPHFALVSFSVFIIGPFLPSLKTQLGIPLVISLFMLGLIMMIYRLYTMGWMPSYFDGLLSSGIHIPFFVLISATGFSILKKQKVSFQKNQNLSLQNAIDETARQKYRHDQQQKFMLMLTHELKNSLSVLRLYIQSDVANIKIFTPLAEQSINDMDSIIDRCSQMDRLDRNQITLHYHPLLLGELIQDLIEKNTNKERIELSQTTPFIQVNTDQVLLKTMLANLLDNALKYSPSASIVQIMVAYTKSETDTIHHQDKNAPHIHSHIHSHNMILISVSNHVLPSELPSAESIFKKYYRGPHANRTTGSGLGLYVSKSMAELLGGYLSYSEQQEIVTMKLWLPI
jgi:signal transduction histidine kinase